MPVPYERAVIEDLNTGHGTVSVTLPNTTTGTGNQIGIHSFLRDVYNVRDFLATGDGVTDDTTAIQNAINQADNNGGVVYIPSGNYRITAPLNLSTTRDSTAMHIIGEGAGPWNSESTHTTRITNDNDNDAIRVRSTGHTIIENLTILDNLTAPNRNVGAGIFAERDTAGNVVLEVRNVYIEGHQDSVRLIRSIVSKISRVVGSAPERDGIRLESTASGSGTSTMIENCFINTPGQDGYAVDGYSYTSFHSCAVDTAGRYGYHVHGTTRISNGISLFGCGAENPTNHCVFLDDQANSVNAVLISGGLFSGSAQDGININMSDGVTIIGPKIQSNTGSGIEIQSGNYITIISPHFSTNTAGDIIGAGLANALYIAAPNTGAFTLGHVTATGLNAGDVGLRNVGAIRWLNNAGATSANYGIVGSTGDHLNYGVPGTGNQHLFSFAGTARMRFEESGGRAVIRMANAAGDPGIFSGSATPEGAITAPVGSIFFRTDGGAGTSLYVKESGTGNTGWVGK